MIKQEKLYDGWIFIKLGEVAEIIMGQSPPSSTYNKENSGLPFFQGKTEFGRRYPKIKMYCSSPKKTATENDILMSVRAPVGPVNIANNDCCIGRGLCAIRSSDKLDFMYLYHFLKANEVQISSKGTGSTFTAINKKTIHELEIPLPPIQTQKKIVVILEKAERLKEWRKEADELTDELLKCTFLEMFGDPVKNTKGWDTEKIEKIAKVKTGGTPDRAIKEYWNNGNISWVKTTEIKGKTIVGTEECITEQGFNNSNATIIPKNSILIAMYGQGKTRGKTAKLGFDATTNQACAALLPSDNYISDFLLHLLKLSYHDLRSLGRGGNQPNLNLSIIKKINVYLPPLELQQKFASIVQQVEQLREHQSQSRQHIDDLFNVLMQKAFKGELA